MNNIYLTSTKLSWKAFVKCNSIAFIFGVICILMKRFNIIQINSEVMYNLIVCIMYILILVQLINPKLTKCIINELRFRSESLKAVIIPILAAIGTRILIDMLQILPEIFGGSIIHIAKGQTDLSTYAPVERIVVGSLLGPYSEELLFRVVFFTSIAYALGYVDSKFNSNYSNKVINLKSIFCWLLIIIDNILFSLMHCPDSSNFHLYFIPGLVNTIIYIKYGFYGSWLSHGFCNFFHPNLIYSWLGIR